MTLMVTLQLFLGFGAGEVIVVSTCPVDSFDRKFAFKADICWCEREGFNDEALCEEYFKNDEEVVLDQRSSWVKESFIESYFQLFYFYAPPMEFGLVGGTSPVKVRACKDIRQSDELKWYDFVKLQLRHRF